MKIATTIRGMESFVDAPSKMIEAYNDTGFNYLDYDFYNVLTTPGHYFMSNDWKKYINDIKCAAEKHGFRFVQAHAPKCVIRGKEAELGILATVRAIEACGILGIKNMVIHSGFFPEIKYLDGQDRYFRENEKFFRSLIPAMEENNVNILFENTTSKHCIDDCYFPRLAKDLNSFVEFMNHPLFGAAWDVGHANMDGIDHYTQIMELGKNLKAIHIHDNNGTLDQHFAPFMGNCDYDSLMRGLIESGYDGYFTLEVDNFFEYRQEKTFNGLLSNINLEIKKEVISLLYSISKYILSSYNVYES